MPESPEQEWSFVEHEGHRIACLAHEVADSTLPPIVWVHGLTASARFWDAAMFIELVEGRSWYSISLPFHAPSTFRKRWKPFRMDEDLLAKLLREPIDQLIPEGEFHLVGHSLGGFAALNCAAKFPDRVASVVAIGSFMNGRARGMERLLQFFSRGVFVRSIAFYLGYRVLKLHWKVLAFVSLFYAKRRFRLLRNPSFRKTVQAIFPDVKKHPIRQQRLLIRSLIEMDLFDEVKEITCPVLMVIGMEDPVIPSYHQIEAAEKLDNVTVARFETSGHLPFGESPKEFVRVLGGWLDR